MAKGLGQGPSSSSLAVLVFELMAFCCVTQHLNHLDTTPSHVIQNEANKLGIQ